MTLDKDRYRTLVREAFCVDLALLEGYLHERIDISRWGPKGSEIYEALDYPVEDWKKGVVEEEIERVKREWEEGAEEVEVGGVGKVRGDILREMERENPAGWELAYAGRFRSDLKYRRFVYLEKMRLLGGLTIEHFLERFEPQLLLITPQEFRMGMQLEGEPPLPPP